jgi:hypothetical protein
MTARDRAPESPPALLEDDRADPSDDEASNALLELIAAPAERAPAPRPPQPERIDGIVVARLVAIEAGAARVDFPGNWRDEPLAARTLVALEPAHVGREVALSFELGRPDAPIVTGIVQRLDADPESVVVTAEKDLVLRCGSASITLTRAGKIMIRGEYVLSRATGVQRIQGGTVEIN